MKILRFITVCAAVSLVASTAGFAQHVQTDFDHQAKFAQYKTYSWQEITPGSSPGGFAHKRQRTLQTFYDGFGGGWRSGGSGGFGESTTTEQDYQEGTLVIDIYDGKSKQLIWRVSTEKCALRQSREERKESRQRRGQDVQELSAGIGKR